MQKANIIWYHPDLVLQARELRNNCTPAEKILWHKLKGKQLDGYDFHRQKPLCYYIVDFYCPRLRLAIEINGTIHLSEDNKSRDIKRQEELEDMGISFLRYTNSEVLDNVDDVVQKIYRWIEENKETGLTHP